MSIGSCFRLVFDQLGIYEEFNKIGKPNHKMEVYNGDLDPLFTLDFQARESMYVRLFSL